MDFLPETVNLWLLSYGSWALFGLLALGIIAFPIPEETLLIIAGVLISKGKLPLVPAAISAYLGSGVGMTISYLIGLTGGVILIQRYGSIVGLNEKKLSKAHQWFEKYGKWCLIVGYFIPGLRHLVGVCAGISTLKYASFALFAYIGAMVWVATFLSIGYFFGNHYEKTFAYIESHLEAFFLGLVLLFALGAVLYKGWCVLRERER